MCFANQGHKHPKKEDFPGALYTSVHNQTKDVNSQWVQTPTVPLASKPQQYPNKHPTQAFKSNKLQYVGLAIPRKSYPAVVGCDPLVAPKPSLGPQLLWQTKQGLPPKLQGHMASLAAPAFVGLMLSRSTWTLQRHTVVQKHHESAVLQRLEGGAKLTIRTTTISSSYFLHLAFFPPHFQPL